MTYRAIYDQVHYAGFVAGDGERGFERNVRTMIKRMRHKFEAIDPDSRPSGASSGRDTRGTAPLNGLCPPALAVDVAAAGP